MPYSRPQYANGAESTLSSGLAASAAATSIIVTTGHGTRFPTPTAPGDYYLLSLINSTGAVEIVKVTARSEDTLTVVRAQEGTSATLFGSGDFIAMTPTAGTMQGLANSDGWSRETNAVAYASAATFTVVGDQTDTYVENRAIRLTQTTNATGYVLSSAYTTSTTVTVYGVTVDSGLAGVDFGLSPASMVSIGDVVRGYTRQQYATVVVLTAQTGTVNINAGTHQDVSISATGNITLSAPSSSVIGMYITMTLYAASALTITWNSVYKANSDVALPTAFTAGKRVILSFRCYDGTNWLLMGKVQEV